MYLPLWTPNARARVVRDDPPMHGFGKRLHIGDVVTVTGVTWRGKFEVAVFTECAFYEMVGYFEPMVEFPEVAP